MSINKNQFFRLNVIDDLLSSKSWVKTSFIKSIVSEKSSENISIRTIQNDIRALKDDADLGYFAPIQYDNKQKAYRYSEPGYSIKKCGLKNDEVTAFKFYAQCLSAFSGYSIFADFTSGLNKIIDGVSIRSRIHRNANPQTIIEADSFHVAQGNEYLSDAVYAIDNLYKIELGYQGFDSKTLSKRIVCPYFIKEYRHRWYLLAASPKESKIKTFAFDRIKSLRVVEEKFTKNVAFKPEEYFRYSFGITTPDDKVERIVMRFCKTEGPYIKSLPIHPSQELIGETSDYLDIAITVRFSYELKEYILSKTPTVTVLSPQHLADEIVTLLSGGLKNYSKKATPRK